MPGRQRLARKTIVGRANGLVYGIARSGDGVWRMFRRVDAGRRRVPASRWTHAAPQRYIEWHLLSVIQARTENAAKREARRRIAGDSGK